MKKPASTICVPDVWQLCQRLSKGRHLRLTLLWVLLLANAAAIYGNCVISCRDINISLNPDGQAILSPSFVLADPSCDPIEFSLQVFNEANQQISDTLNCSSVNEVLSVKVIHVATGNRCWSQVTVQDYLAPVIDCKDTLLYCTQSTEPAVIGFPDVVDNCTPLAQISLTYTDQYEDLPCFFVYQNDSVTAHVERIWTAIDAHGNSSTCVQHIYLKRSTVDDVVFPASRDGFVFPKLNCLDDPTDLNLTGVPTIGGNPIDINGACELVVSFTDQSIPQCGSRGEKILRTWTVIDWCSGDFNLDVQLISVADTTAPILTCPANITVSTDYFDCAAQVTLPTTTATDDCSEINIQPSWVFGTGYGPFSQVPVGVYEVLYVATDACGNQDTCTMQVTVEDQLAPVAVCDANTIVALGNNGSAQVSVLSFDDGSYDNCDLDFLEVKRENGVFSQYVYFDCSDVGQQIEITLRVHDKAGNYNECTVLAEVKDLWRPVISCPETIQLDCGDDYLDTSLTGIPMITENCSLDTFFFSDQLNLNSCGLGEVRRKWWARDVAGNESWCEQLILIRDTTSFNIIFPDNYVTNQCTSFITPDSSGQPEIIGTDCELIGVSYSDQIFPVSGISCYKVFRTWTVVDWCTYVANSGSDIGSWTKTQLITVHDDTSPELVCPADTVVSFWGTDCNQGMLVSIEDLIVIDCDTAVTVTNDSPFAFNSGNNASGNYPPGAYEITFTATDGCGNVSTCAMEVIVVDAKAPSPVCESGISVSLNAEGFVLVDPALLTVYVEDNCSDPAQIDILLSRDSFTCDDVGEQMVDVIYIDEAGNQASCEVIVTITDGLGVCPSSSITGLIRTERGRKVAGVDVFLEGEEVNMTSTDAQGRYEFDQLTIGGDFTVVPEKEGNHRNGISTFDLILISRHMVGMNRFSSPYQIIAADVNNSGSVSTFDVIELRKMILYINEQFPNSPSWRFIPEAYTFSQPTNPFRTMFPEFLSYEDLGSNVSDANFVAIKVGDVNDSASTDEVQSSSHGETRNNNKFSLDISYRPGRTANSSWMEVRFSEDANLAGMQLGLGLPMQEMIDMELGTLNGLSPGNFFKDDVKNELRLSWHNASTVKVEKGQLFFRVLIKGVSRTEVNIISQLNAEAYLETDGQLITTPISLYKAPIRNYSEKTGSFRCFPNPVRDKTTIEFNLLDRSCCELQVFDPQGKLVYSFGGFYEPGIHEVKVERKDLGRMTGMYVCRLKRDQQPVSSLPILVID